MRGTTALRPQRLLLLSSSRSGGALSRSAAAASAVTAAPGVCLLCQHCRTVTTTTRPSFRLQQRQQQQQFPPYSTQQQRSLAWTAKCSAQIRRSNSSSQGTGTGTVKEEWEGRQQQEEKTTSGEEEQVANNNNALNINITNYYTAFPQTIPGGPPPNSPFDIPVSTLRREFLQLQALAHPDKYPPGPAKDCAETLSARINEAYRTLADPLRRAQYLLAQWHGIDVTAEDGAAAAKHALDPEMLMEVMDVQETIEDVSASPVAEAEATINRLREENAARVQASVKALGEAFDRGDIEAARAECVRLRFWYSLNEGLREWEPGAPEIRIVH
jgi:molecular chaperone HscB